MEHAIYQFINIVIYQLLLLLLLLLIYISIYMYVYIYIYITSKLGILWSILSNLVLLKSKSMKMIL